MAPVKLVSTGVDWVNCQFRISLSERVNIPKKRASAKISTVNFFMLNYFYHPQVQSLTRRLKGRKTLLIIDPAWLTLVWI